MKTKQTKEEKAMDKAIESAYYKIASGQQISILDIPKVFAESRRAILAGAAVDQAVRAAVLMYCMEAK
jgi:hypothetical protein